MDNDVKNFAGKDGFIWWTGIIEDRQDPLRLGRCKVRCIGWHSDNKMQLPTSDLPWAIPISPVNDTSIHAPKEGDMVFGFFIDGDAAQNPMILGVLPSIPLKKPNPQNAFEDNRSEEQLRNAPRKPKSREHKEDGSGTVTSEYDVAFSYPYQLDEPSSSRLSRNDHKIGDSFIQFRKDTIISGVSVVNSNWDEPITEYAAQYPYNYVMETESGHILEFDDTFGKERIHLSHRTGTFFEIFPDGKKVEKITGNNYQILMMDDHIYIMGKALVTIQGDVELRVMKDCFVKVDGNVDMNVDGNFKAQIAGQCDIQSGGEMNLVGSKINLN